MRIAVVDDEEVFRNQISSEITKLYGRGKANCFLYADGSEILRAMHGGLTYDALFLDILVTEDKMNNDVIRGKRAGRIDTRERKILKRPNNWDTHLRDKMRYLGFVGDRYIYGQAAFEPETVGLIGNCGDIIRWKDPTDPKRKLRQYMILLDQIKPGLFVAIHVQPLPPTDSKMYI